MREGGKAVKRKGREEGIDLYTAFRTTGEKDKLKSRSRMHSSPGLQEVWYYGTIHGILISCVTRASHRNSPSSGFLRGNEGLRSDDL